MSAGTDRLLWHGGSGHVVFTGRDNRKGYPDQGRTINRIRAEQIADHWINYDREIPTTANPGGRNTQGQRKDLKNFFDEVDHCILLQLIYRKIKCPLTMRLIRKWMRAPISIKGKLTKRRKGVPQGSPLSPLLSNIMLHELDKEMERRVAICPLRWWL